MLARAGDTALHGGENRIAKAFARIAGAQGAASTASPEARLRRPTLTRSLVEVNLSRIRTSPFIPEHRDLSVPIGGAG